MKQVVLTFVFATILVAGAASQSLQAVDASSSVTFEIRNLGVAVVGRLSDLQGVVEFDPNDLKHSSFRLSVAAKTISTGIGLRDRHLQKEEYLHVAQFPRIEFRSVRIEKSGEQLVVVGNLILKGVSQTVSIPVRASTLSVGYEFAGEFTINRRHFGVGSGSFTLADELVVSFRIVAQ